MSRIYGLTYYSRYCGKRESKMRYCNYITAIGFANLSRAICWDMFAFPHFVRKLSKLAK